MSIGDVNSGARGSGARYNTGKPDYSLVPLRLMSLAISAFMNWYNARVTLQRAS